MKVSIITATYNSAEYLETCINSVLSQGYENIEYIIIDGGSTDDTLNIVKSYGRKVHKCISEPDLGIYDAMNKGIALATGDIIGILNSDDLYADEDVISDVVYEFQRLQDVSIVYGDLVYVKQNNVDAIVRRWNSMSYYNRFFEDGNVPPHPSLFVRSDVYVHSGFFNLEYKLAADYDFMIRIFKVHEVKSFYINRLIVKMRLGGATNKNLKNIIRGNREILKSWSKNRLRVPIFLMPIRLVSRLKQFF